MRTPRSAQVLKATPFALFTACVLIFANCGCAPKAHFPIAFRASTPEISIPFATVTLPNGLTVWITKDSELPLTRGTLYMPRGQFWERAEDRGLTSAAMFLLRRGGTLNASPEAREKYLQTHAFAFGTSSGEEYSTLSFEGLAPASDELLNFIGESIVAPGFDAEMLTLWKENQLQAIQKRVFQPRAIGGALFRELLYGGVPYGEPLTSAAITRITPARVKQYYNRFFQPSGAILVISTDREIESIKPLLNNAFGAWSAKVPAVDFPATAPRSAAPGIYFVPRSMAQAIILVGQIGIDRKYPHQLASNTLNRIFGANSFDSRLFREIRTARGLAYNISATINPRLVQGPNLIQVATNADKTGILIDATLRELAMLQKDGVTSTELEKAKLALSHNFILKRPSPFAALKRRAARAILGYPNPDEYGFLKNLHKLSQQSVSEAATLWRTRELLFVIVGNPIAAKSLAHEIKRKDSMLFELPFYQVDFTEKVDQIRRLNF